MKKILKTLKESNIKVGTSKWFRYVVQFLKIHNTKNYFKNFSSFLNYLANDYEVKQDLTEYIVFLKKRDEQPKEISIVPYEQNYIEESHTIDLDDFILTLTNLSQDFCSLAIFQQKPISQITEIIYSYYRIINWLIATCHELDYKLQDSIIENTLKFLKDILTISDEISLPKYENNFILKPSYDEREWSSTFINEYFINLCLALLSNKELINLFNAIINSMEKCNNIFSINIKKKPEELILQFLFNNNFLINGITENQKIIKKLKRIPINIIKDLIREEMNGIKKFYDDTKRKKKENKISTAFHSIKYISPYNISSIFGIMRIYPEIIPDIEEDLKFLSEGFSALFDDTVLSPYAGVENTSKYLKYFLDITVTFNKEKIKLFEEDNE